MTKPISTRTHGMIDYAYAATLIGLPLAFGWSGRAARLSIGAGIATLGLSLATRYELGLIPLISMEGHLAADAAESSLLLSAPKMLGADQQTAGRILAALGLVGGWVVSLTQTTPKHLPASS
jgi:hypothetical protein